MISEKYNAQIGNYLAKLAQSKPKPQTNADRIRSMTDEELAELIGDNIDCAICRKKHYSDDCPKPYPGSCYDVWLDWLKEEASE